MLEYIEFSGAGDRVGLQAIIEFARELKQTHATPHMMIDEDIAWELVKDPRWSKCLTDELVKRIETDPAYDFEWIVESLLIGEYELHGVEFADGVGKLVYDPLAFPFGGTDPLKATVEAFGFNVRGDSHWDGFAEWVRKRDLNDE